MDVTRLKVKPVFVSVSFLFNCVIDQLIVFNLRESVQVVYFFF